jgi:hypothetical protein
MVKLVSQSSNNTQFVRAKGYVKLIKDHKKTMHHLLKSLHTRRVSAVYSSAIFRDVTI